MTKHILFVCKSCNTKSEEGQNEKQRDGSALLDQLLALHQNWSRQSELEIQAVSCLWTCSNPCTVALSGTNKSTYLFTDLPLAESADALIQFIEHYLDSNNGDVVWKRCPKVMESSVIAQIPPIPH
jgi:predicted metal-binding protein